jgi:hypothetical protein
MQHLGLSPEDYAPETVEVWPENEQAYFLFASLQTQWRAGAMGLIGLDYNTLFHKLDRMGLSASDYDDLEDDIRTMEFAAIEAMNSERD